jgi:hypothetical protein
MREELEKVVELQKLMGYYDLAQRSKTFKMEYLRNITLATHVELTEFLQEVSWKPWCNDETITEQQALKAADELTDVMVFTLVLWATLNPTVEIDKALKATFDKIEKRIKETCYGNHS